MRVFSLLIASLVLMSTAGCTAGHRIRRFDPQTPVVKGDQAAYYSLPRTVVTVTIPVEKTEYTKRDDLNNEKHCYERLNENLGKLAGGTKALTIGEAVGIEKKDYPTSYKITGNVTLDPRAEPDPDQIFRVDLGSSAFRKQNLDLTFGSLGVLKSGTSIVQDKRLDIGIAFAKSILSAGVVAYSLHVDPLKAIVPGAPPDFCRDLAREIYESRQALRSLQVQIASGTVGTPGETIDWAQNRIDEDIQKKLQAHFLRKTVAAGEIVCEIRPKAITSRPPEVTARYEALRLKPDVGFWDGTDAFCLIPDSFRGQEGVGDSFYLKTDVRIDQFSEKLRAGGVDLAHNDGSDQGFYYRVPAVARVRFSQGQTTLADDELIIAQYGIVAALPRQSTYQTKYTVKLDPDTGALEQLIAESEAVDKSLVSDAFAGVQAVLEAEKERDAAKDELALLERERKILEEHKKIRDFKRELGESDEAP